MSFHLQTSVSFGIFYHSNLKRSQEGWKAKHQGWHKQKIVAAQLREKVSVFGLTYSNVFNAERGLTKLCSTMYVNSELDHIIYE